jgi:hypothetical protein
MIAFDFHLFKMAIPFCVFCNPFGYIEVLSVKCSNQLFRGAIEIRYIISNTMSTSEFAHFSIYRETYKETPFIVVPNSISPRPIGLNFYISILSGDKFRIAAKGENVNLCNSVGNEFIRKVGKIEIDKVYRFGEEIVNGNFNFKLAVNNNFFRKQLQPMKMRTYIQEV